MVTISKEARGNVHDTYEIARRSEKVKEFKKENKSCRTCKHFYHRRLPRHVMMDGKMVEESHNNTMCGLKNKPVAHYNICEYWTKLVVVMKPL